MGMVNLWDLIPFMRDHGVGRKYSENKNCSNSILLINLTVDMQLFTLSASSQ